MGLNTIHKNKKDLATAYNLTKEFSFKCEVLDEITQERITAAMGLEMPTLRLTIKVNGIVNVDEKDKIRIVDEVFKVAKKSDKFTNKLQFRKRSDYKYFNNETLIFLE
jgi:hypothetical protein